MEIVASHDRVSASSVLGLCCIKCPSDDITVGYSHIHSIFEYQTSICMMTSRSEYLDGYLRVDCQTSPSQMDIPYLNFSHPFTTSLHDIQYSNAIHKFVSSLMDIRMSVRWMFDIRISNIHLEVGQMNVLHLNIECASVGSSEGCLIYRISI